MQKFFLKPVKKKAQGVMEFSLSFIFIMLFFFAFVEYAFYWQTFHTTQTFADDLNSNLSLMQGSEICGAENPAVLELVTQKGRRYFEPNLSLNYTLTAPHQIRLSSTRTYRGKNTMQVDIICNSLSYNGTRTEATYLFRGFLFFITGHYVSSISSVHTPNF